MPAPAGGDPPGRLRQITKTQTPLLAAGCIRTSSNVERTKTSEKSNLSFSDPHALRVYLTFYLAGVRVQECQLEFAMGFRFHRTGRRRRRKKKEEEGCEGVAPLLKSRDPHLAGGEPTI